MFTLTTMVVGIRRYFPSNIVLARLRTRAGLKWGVPAMMLALPYLLLAVWLHSAGQSADAGWMSVFAVICAMSAIKFLVFGPVSLVLLLAARIREARYRRAAARTHAALAMT